MYNRLGAGCRHSGTYKLNVSQLSIVHKAIMRFVLLLVCSKKNYIVPFSCSI
jgi:hypothetical protein